MIFYQVFFGSTEAEGARLEFLLVVIFYLFSREIEGVGEEGVYIVGCSWNFWDFWNLVMAIIHQILSPLPPPSPPLSLSLLLVCR